ncbi:hypothetical protein [Streptomyces sp. NEAU-YJ-81]|nr:hypothetical protein [Streptomyces sp. NEAU-YJ-81]MBO3682715.1 hypothetical protein [Streptomyces sp. NEAU-YJ-81]
MGADELPRAARHAGVILVQVEAGLPHPPQRRVALCGRVPLKGQPFP